MQATRPDDDEFGVLGLRRIDEFLGRIATEQ
jgi:hypothetical protein